MTALSNARGTLGLETRPADGVNCDYVVEEKIQVYAEIFSYYGLLAKDYILEPQKT